MIPTLREFLKQVVRNPYKYLVTFVPGPGGVFWGAIHQIMRPVATHVYNMRLEASLLLFVFCLLSSSSSNPSQSPCAPSRPEIITSAMRNAISLLYILTVAILLLHAELYLSYTQGCRGRRI
jgi:hypothetical protein